MREEGESVCDELIWRRYDAPPVGDPGRPRRERERILWVAKERQPRRDAKANGAPSKWIGANTRSKAWLKWLSGNAEYSEGIARCRDLVSIPVCETDSRGHPAAYPRDLAAWMIRLVTPPGGTVLDPFAGSGTTLLAAVQEGFSAIGIEREPEYCEIIRRRMEAAGESEDDVEQMEL